MMMLEPVVLPSGDCAACHGQIAAMICGYSGHCPYCNSALATGDLERDLAQAEDEIADLKSEKLELAEELINLKEEQTALISENRHLRELLNAVGEVSESGNDAS